MGTQEALEWAERARNGELSKEDYDKSFEVACTLANFIITSLGAKYKG